MSEEGKGLAGLIVPAVVIAGGIAAACLPNCFGNRRESSAKVSRPLEECVDSMRVGSSFRLKEIPNGFGSDTYNIYLGRNLVGKIRWESPNYIIWAGDFQQKISQFTKNGDVFSGYGADNSYLGRVVSDDKAGGVEVYDGNNSKIAFFNDSKFGSKTSLPIYSVSGNVIGALEKLGYSDSYDVSGNINPNFLLCLAAVEDRRLDKKQAEAIADAAESAADD